MVKITFVLIFSDPEIVLSLCFVFSDPEAMFLHFCPFLIKIMGM